MLHDNVALVRPPMILDLHRYWSTLLGGRTMPAKRDLDPMPIKPILPYLLLAEIVGERPRVRYRLVGTEVALANGYGLRLEYEFALLPLSENGTDVHFSLGIEDYSAARERSRDDWRKVACAGRRPAPRR